MIDTVNYSGELTNEQTITIADSQRGQKLINDTQSPRANSYMASGNFNPAEIKRQIEGGDNMRDIAECHQSEIGEIIWLHKSGNESTYIAKKLRVKLYQVDQLIQDVMRLSESI